MKLERGAYGYIREKKKNQLIGLVLMVVLGIGIFVAGLLLNKMSKANVFTVAAGLCVLPGANYLTKFVVLFPYHTPKKEWYDKVKSMISQDMVLFCDMVITSSEKVMNLDFIVVSDNSVIGLVGRKGQDVSYINQYLTKGVRNWGSGYRVKICDTYESFIKEMKKVTRQESTRQSEEKEEVLSYIRSLVV